MDDAIKLFLVFAAMGLSGAAVYAAVLLTGVLARRLERRPPEADLALQQEMEEFRARLDESDQLRGRVTELEERLEFAERLLARQREPGRLTESEGR